MTRRQVAAWIVLLVWCLFWGTILAVAFQSLDLGL